MAQQQAGRARPCVLAAVLLVLRVWHSLAIKASVDRHERTSEVLILGTSQCGAYGTAGLFEQKVTAALRATPALAQHTIKLNCEVGTLIADHALEGFPAGTAKDKAVSACSQGTPEFIVLFGGGPEVWNSYSVTVPELRAEAQSFVQAVSKHCAGAKILMVRPPMYFGYSKLMNAKGSLEDSKALEARYQALGDSMQAAILPSWVAFLDFGTPQYCQAEFFCGVMGCDGLHFCHHVDPVSCHVMDDMAAAMSNALIRLRSE